MASRRWIPQLRPPPSISSTTPCTLPAPTGKKFYLPPPNAFRVPHGISAPEVVESQSRRLLAGENQENYCLPDNRADGNPHPSRNTMTARQRMVRVITSGEDTKIPAFMSLYKLWCRATLTPSALRGAPKLSPKHLCERSKRVVHLRAEAPQELLRSHQMHICADTREAGDFACQLGYTAMYRQACSPAVPDM